jgi:serine/threonine-protein phosphatase PGAM5
MKRSDSILGLVLALALAAPATRARAADPTEPGHGIRYLLLVRHGAYDRDEHADDLLANGVNALGREQARRVAVRLAALPMAVRTLVSSDLTRARETAEEIGRELGVVPSRDSLLRECTPPSLRSDPMLPSPPEDRSPCEAQLEAAWARYARPSPSADVHEILVCHGNVIRWFVCRALGLDTRRWSQMDIANASLTVIAVRPDGSPRLVLFSDVGHLPVPLQTWVGRGAGWGATPVR